jgi:PAS domain S-box-containing protein
MHIPLESAGIIADLQDGKVHAIADLDSLSRPSALEQRLQAAGMRSYINFPLIAHGVLVGSLNLATKAIDGFTSEHVDIASELANQLAIAVRQARLFEQVQHYAEELEQQVAARTAELGRRTVQLQVAAEVARDATAAPELDELLARSVDLVRERFGFYHAGIFLTDEAGEYAVLQSATGDAGQQMLEQGHRLKVGETGIVGYVCASGEPRTALDTGTDATHFDNPCLPETRSEMALPMRVGDRVIGALDVQSTSEAAFDEDDVEILQVMADQLAVSIERTRLFEQVQATLEERLRVVIDNTPIAIAATDAEGVITLLEGKGLEGTGLVPAEMIGRTTDDAFRDSPQIVENVQRALDGEAFVTLVEINDLIFETQYSPLRDQAGESMGMISLAVDVTEHHHMQAQMHQQARLAAVGQLAGGIAHDFNNFLMTIIFYAHLLQNRTETTDITSVADTIMGEAKRATDLVRQVLDFSRRSVIETKPIDLASFVEEVIEILRRTLPENIRVETGVEEGDYVVEIDPTRIQQVLMNLALNSRDAMPEGGDLRIQLSQLTVAPKPSMPPGIVDMELVAGDWVCLSIQDTGTGMDEQVREHLFEPFFTTKGAQGNGLGLAQVYGIVKQHEGEIGVETELGGGTTFRIYLPARATNQDQAADAEDAAAIPQGRGETILFVEDEEKVREAGQDVLESLGYDVLAAANGKEGLEAFRQAQRVDLILTDMVMPEMGGREMIKELKQVAPGVKTLVITGYTMQEDIQALKDTGLAGIIHKPLDVQTLARAVRRALDARHE